MIDKWIARENKRYDRMIRWQDFKRKWVWEINFIIAIVFLIVAFLFQWLVDK